MRVPVVCVKAAEMRCVNTVYAAATFSKCRAVFVRQQQNTCRLRRRLQQSKHTQAVRRSSNTPSSPPEPTGFRQKKGSVPQFLSDYKAEKAADSGNGLLFSDKILHGPVKYGIWALSAGLGAYALLEMPVRAFSSLFCCSPGFGAAHTCSCACCGQARAMCD